MRIVSMSQRVRKVKHTVKAKQDQSKRVPIFLILAADSGSPTNLITKPRPLPTAPV